MNGYDSVIFLFSINFDHVSSFERGLTGRLMTLNQRLIQKEHHSRTSGQLDSN